MHETSCRYRRSAEDGSFGFLDVQFSSCIKHFLLYLCDDTLWDKSAKSPNIAIAEQLIMDTKPDVIHTEDVNSVEKADSDNASDTSPVSTQQPSLSNPQTNPILITL